MGVFSRFVNIFRAKANNLANSLEDPGETLDMAYEKQLNALQKMRAGIAEVVTSQKRLEIEARRLEKECVRCNDLAKTALAQGREDLAASMLTKGQLAEQQLGALNTQIQGLGKQRDQLEHAGERLQAQVSAMRTQKEAMKAQYTAARASVAAGETVAGISKDMGDVQIMLDNAQQKMLQTQARAEALGELMESHTMDRLAAPGSGGPDPVEAEILAREASDSVEQRLLALKQELGISPPAGHHGHIAATHEPEATLAHADEVSTQPSTQEETPPTSE